MQNVKSRGWVKNAAIIFLAVLLVLTFFSNTIMNRSLPEVATAGVTDGSIVARVRGTGVVTANTNTQVKMERTRVIRSVLVKVGQQVNVGDTVLVLEAMKMQNNIESEYAGQVTSVLVKQGDTVMEGAVMLTIG